VGAHIWVFPQGPSIKSMVRILLVGLTLSAGNLQAQEVGNLHQGLRIARAVCAECHLVDKAPGLSSNPAAPTFAQIANTPGMSSAALTVALRTSHEKMPNLIITGSDLSDVVAYILSLREGR